MAILCHTVISPPRIVLLNQIILFNLPLFRYNNIDYIEHSTTCAGRSPYYYSLKRHNHLLEQSDEIF